MAAELINVLSKRGGADGAFLFVESIMGALAALGGPAALTTVASAMNTGRNQFRILELPQTLAWVASVSGKGSKASAIDKAKAYAMFLFYFCDVGCYLGHVAPGAVVSAATAGAAGKYSLLTWGTYVVLSVYTNYKAFKAAKPDSAEQQKAKWALIRESLWRVCIINWVRAAPCRAVLCRGVLPRRHVT